MKWSDAPRARVLSWKVSLCLWDGRWSSDPEDASPPPWLGFGPTLWVCLQGGGPPEGALTLLAQVISPGAQRLGLVSWEDPPPLSVSTVSFPSWGVVARTYSARIAFTVRSAN